jgi:hypothetical protein
MDFYHQVYFESVFNSYIESDAVPHITQLSQMAQACAILRRSEYTSTLCEWFTSVLVDYKEENFF